MKTLWLFLALAAGTTELSASEYPPPEQIRAWVSQGEILPLEQILAAQPLPGQLLDAELEWEDDCLVYELKWIDPSGRRHKQYVNARSGQWLDDPEQNCE